MQLRRTAALGLALALLAAPVAGAVCETRCGSAPEAATAAPGAAASCHRAGEGNGDSRQDGRITARHACADHAALTPVRARASEVSRGVVKPSQATSRPAPALAALTAGSATPVVARGGHAPPGPDPQSIAPLRI
jgi:hypothetical protein